MNIFTQYSIELANQRNYLDQLFKVYPLRPDNIREIDKSVWERIERHYKNNNNQELFRALLELKLFPVKDGYVSFFRRDKDAIERNPETVDRICGRVREYDLDKLYEKCTQPKETNRQMGPLFKKWIASGVLGKKPVPRQLFVSSEENAILEGSDKALAQFARENLGYNRKKGVDFVARWNHKYIIGEAKFISDEGGHQNAQLLDAITTMAQQTDRNVIYIGILDGVLYIPSKKKMYKTITQNNLPVMSALLLRDYLYSL